MISWLIMREESLPQSTDVTEVAVGPSPTRGLSGWLARIPYCQSGRRISSRRFTGTCCDIAIVMPLIS